MLPGEPGLDRAGLKHFAPIANDEFCTEIKHVVAPQGLESAPSLQLDKIRPSVTEVEDAVPEPSIPTNDLLIVYGRPCVESLISTNIGAVPAYKCAALVTGCSPKS